MNDLPSVIGAIGGILATVSTFYTAYLGYNQYTRNKLTDLKIEQWKKDEERRSLLRSGNIGKIYGDLWKLLHIFNADRVYIIQPHPLINNSFISVALEVKRNSIASMKDVIKKTAISDVAVFCSELERRDFMFYRNINEEVKDKKARAILSSNGTCAAIIKRLSDDKHEWIGNIVCEFTHAADIMPDYARKEINDLASVIQYILPEYKEEN